ncbi:PLP-dependent aminotransferase family protein [Crocinitomix algicola]|uniref:PLP-dependent transferase n=1 Tax=Crocinitomix algicola TaxID=1740263 RepID=UPI0008732231|nr:PLP-dependent transferase [Crocinitomix algicola]
MNEKKMLDYLKEVIKNLPEDWLNLTTHRLDIYNEEEAKYEFLDEFEKCYANLDASKESLKNLPTAYDYIRLGHPLSSVLEWAIAQLNGLQADQVISFSSNTVPVFAVLRTNLLKNKSTRILYTGELPNGFDTEVMRRVYNYQFEFEKVNDLNKVGSFDGSTILLTEQSKGFRIDTSLSVDFTIQLTDWGSVFIVNNEQNRTYISDVQHVRRRETIAMTPSNTLMALNLFVNNPINQRSFNTSADKKKVLTLVNEITNTTSPALAASSGLSMQYAIVMGLIEDAIVNHPGKAIKIVVPPNCYGGTNDQARRVAAVTENVEVMDLPVDGGNDMVSSVDKILTEIAALDAVPYIIAEIPTNPRVEVPNLDELKTVLSKERKNSNGEIAIDPVFILDQTFCPNVHFLGEDNHLANVRTIAYVSGSKFPSGGKCTAGYCVANKKAESLIAMIEKHLLICENEATPLQYEILAKQMPSMVQRIADAYVNTREFVRFIESELPAAKINFVSEELAKEGFTPSVFSLDLPTKGETPEEREAYKRMLNNRLIEMMITQIPNESKYCVSYGQLKGCYWTIPATSTQGTTKEADKDYIARVSLSPNLDLEKHKAVFKAFVETL